jgi:hypothetical protein
MLDGLYRTADRYLADLSRVSGGKLHRADTLGLLPAAFSQIAAELRQQYSLGYYPTNAARDGKYRKIQVKVSRKDVVVRARPAIRPQGEVILEFELREGGRSSVVGGRCRWSGGRRYSTGSVTDRSSL